MATEIERLTPQREYRPTEYVQGWLSWWFNEEKHLQAAKLLQKARITFLRQTRTWNKDRELKAEGFDIANNALNSLLHKQLQEIDSQLNVTALLQQEA
ncbi:CRISPR-associated endonuclease Cas1 [Chelonobacter oris]|uniref:hypothetical protein n=1 Tax=Chelonobacter oris TaxID=505317 RepID=UPI000A82CC38|nr:hypothetical protein [Chelonobacter oris]